MGCIFSVGIKIENGKRDEGLRDWRLGLLVEGKEILGDGHLGFRFRT